MPDAKEKPQERPSLAFRKAVARDLRAVAKMYNESFGKFVETRETPRNMSIAMNNPYQMLLVAENEEDHKIAGFILLNANSPTGVKNLNTDVLAVDKEYRRRGLGRELMEYAEEIGLTNKFNAMTLQVHEDNAPAINLYKNMGYHQVGRNERYYRDGSASFEMKKTLVPKEAPQPWKAAKGQGPGARK